MSKKYLTEPKDGDRENLRWADAPAESQKTSRNQQGEEKKGRLSSQRVQLAFPSSPQEAWPSLDLYWSDLNF